MIKVTIYEESSEINSEINTVELDKYDLKTTIREMKKKLFDSDERDFYILYDVKNERQTFTIPFDDFYGEVQFDINPDDLTLEQALFYYGNGIDNIDMLKIIGGKGGGGNSLPEILDFILHIYNFFNDLAVNHPALTTIAKISAKKSYTLLRKFLKKYDEKYTSPLSFIDYIHSKEIWTISELKKRFDENNVEVLKLLMKVCLYEYDSKLEIFYFPDEIDIGEEYSLIISSKDALEIIKFYLLLMKGDSSFKFSKEGPNHLEYLKSKLTRPMNEEELLKIVERITEEDEIPDEYYNGPE